MKRLFVLSLVAVLSVGLLSIGAFAAEESDSTYVSWNYTCNAQIQAHDPIEMGEVAPNGNNNIDLGSGTIETASNCGYQVSVEATDTAGPATNGEILNRFNLDFISKSRGTWGWTGGTLDNFSNKIFGEVGVSSAASSNWNNWDVDYSFDADGVAAGQYQVDLLYTLSTTD